jgi:hypothetical protein
MPTLDEAAGDLLGSIHIECRLESISALSQPVGKEMYVNDLVDFGNSERLGHRNRIETVAGWQSALSYHVHQQIAGKVGVILHLVGDEYGCVAVDHAARRVGHAGQRSLKAQPCQGLGKDVAIAVRDLSADQLLDDGAFDEGCADATRHVAE